MSNSYHSSDDHRLPAKFICVPCLLKNDVHFTLIEDRFETILTAWADLACFRCVLRIGMSVCNINPCLPRRAIKICETFNPGSAKSFQEISKFKTGLNEQLWKRLEEEGEHFQTHLLLLDLTLVKTSSFSK